VLFAVSYCIALALLNDSAARLQTRSNAAAEGAVLRVSVAAAVSLTLVLGTAGDWHRSKTLAGGEHVNVLLF